LKLILEVVEGFVSTEWFEIGSAAQSGVAWVLSYRYQICTQNYDEGHLTDTQFAFVLVCLKFGKQDVVALFGELQCQSTEDLIFR